jgi:hypothetical protein
MLIQTSTGETFTITCSHLDIIARIKELVQAQERIPPSIQRLIYEGEELEDNRTLTYYGIQTEATIQLVKQRRFAKPVIYLYPPIATRVTARLSLVFKEWQFSAIYPVVPAQTTPHGQEIEWIVDASPSGTLKELNTGLEVSYLYWEAE